MATATMPGQWGRSPSPGCSNNKGGNRGRSRHRQDGGKGGNGGRHQTPGGKPQRRQSWCHFHNKFGAAAFNCQQPCIYPN